MSLFSKNIPSPLGQLTLIAGRDCLNAVLWPSEKPGRVPIGQGIETQSHTILEKAASQLTDYFDGKLTEFDLPVELLGTPFQIKVWNELKQIKFGQTTSYSSIAHAIGSPKAVRAVGTAIGRNPLSIIYPCHRVIGKNGSHHGFAGGIANKKALLSLEGHR